MEQGQTYSHRPVLLDECIEGLRIRPGGLYLDGTLGRAGHSREIAKRLDTGRLVCIDRDQAALDAAQDRLAGCLDKVELIHGNFGDLAELLDGRGLGPFDGMLFDLGVSSPQLDDPERGFSYMHDAPLDMRMDRSEALTAAIVVNEWPQEELKRILWQYGEERYAPQIAAAIARRRADKPIGTTLELVEVIRGAMPAQALREKQHPAKRTFQAIRIELNRELEVLEKNLDDMIDFLDDGGRICVITFHSLEDRIVKNIFRKNEHPCTCPKDFPICVCGKKPKGRVVTRKPILPTEEELRENSRSRSAKLRVFERIRQES